MKLWVESSEDNLIGNANMMYVLKTNEDGEQYVEVPVKFNYESVY